LATWRAGSQGKKQSQQHWSEPVEESPAVDPATGWQISPVIAASLCMKPTPTLTPCETAKVAALKKVSPSFVVMRCLAMRVRGLLRGDNTGNFDRWLDDARHSGVSSMQQFGPTLSRDIEAVRNAIAEAWSSGQAEGQSIA
jgi:hypothetical protein